MIFHTLARGKVYRETMISKQINKVFLIIDVKKVLQKIFNIILSDFASFCMRLKLLPLAQITSPRISKKNISNMILIGNYFHNSCIIPSLQNQRIALIGPGFSGSSSHFLNKFDLIARVGFTGPGSFAPGFSDRCDLSFLAKWHADTLVSAGNINPTDLSSTHFLVREDVERDVVGKLSENFRVSPFSITQSNELFGRVTPNFAPQIIMWLLMQDPSELHITNIDLFIDSRRPSKYATNKIVVYEDDKFRHTNQQMQQSFSQFHNPFTHFSFYRSLRNIRKISYSENLNLIIDRGLNTYRKTLRDIYY